MVAVFVNGSLLVNDVQVRLFAVYNNRGQVYVRE